MKIFLPFAFFVFLIAACSSEGSKGEAEAPASDTADVSMKYRLIPFEPSATFSDASMESMRFSQGKFSFEIGGSSYQLGVQTPDAPQKMCANSAEGQHIHLIVDNEPYAAKYTADFDYEISDGNHYILAFLSRSYHESIKTEAAHKLVKASVEGNSITTEEAVTVPMLFYSRPKGTYVGEDAKRVMLDFYLANVSLGSEYMVQADINGEIHLVESWQPFYIEGLPMGENTITLSLIDKDGQLVDTPLNPVSRTFTLVADPAENQ
jgi:hypothetical protein